MKAARTLAIGTAIVGTLDLADAMIYFGLRNGSTPVRILQSIAAGWLGRGAFAGGGAAAALGLATHFFIAFAIVGTYFAASRRLPILVRRPIVCGALYGVAVYLFMNLVVIPASAVGPQRFVLGPAVNGILIHIFGVGIPAALATRFGGSSVAGGW